MRWPAAARISGDQVKQAGRLLAACALAGGSAWLAGLPEGYWAVITAVVVMQTDLPQTLSAGRNRMVATLAGAAVALVLIALREQGLPTLPLFAAGLVPLAVLAAVAPTLRLGCTTLVVVFLIPAEGDPYLRPLLRVGDILFGAVACLAVAALASAGPSAKAARDQ